MTVPVRASRDELGRWGEQLAADHLRALGWEILDRNWRCRLGELDIVGRDGAAVVAVEVKTRRGLAAGHPLEAVTPAKLRRLRGLIVQWLHDPGGQAEGRGASRARELRIDVVAIVVDPAGGHTLEHRTGVA